MCWGLQCSGRVRVEGVVTVVVVVAIDVTVVYAVVAVIAIDVLVHQTLPENCVER